MTAALLGLTLLLAICVPAACWFGIEIGRHRERQDNDDDARRRTT